jgi:hypothetical protein
METKFQTSFIPKKPLTAPAVISRGGGVSIFTTLSILIFIASIAGAGFAYGWQKHLITAQAQLKADLETSQKEFDPYLIEQLRKANVKIDLSKQLLKNHMDVTGIFGILSTLTTESVRFDSFDFAAPDLAGGKIKVNLHGVGKSFSAIAFQSDVLGQASQGKARIITSPVLSDLSVDQNGYVGFSLSVQVSQKDLLYSNLFSTAAPTPAPANVTNETQ